MLLGKSVLFITCLMDNSSIWRGGITIQKNSNTNHTFFRASENGSWASTC